MQEDELDLHDGGGDDRDDMPDGNEDGNKDIGQAHRLVSHGMSWPVPVQVSNSGKVIGWTSSILSRSKIVMTVTMMATVAIHCGDPGVFHGMGLPGELAAVPAGLHQAAASDSTPLTLPPLPTTAAHGSTSCLLTI